MKKGLKMTAAVLAASLVFTSANFEVLAANASNQNEAKLQVKKSTTSGDAIASKSTTEVQYQGEGYHLTYSIVNQQDKQYEVAVNIKNTGDKAIRNWAIRYDGADRIETIWNAMLWKQTDAETTIKNAQWNMDIQPGETVSFGMILHTKEDIHLPDKFQLLGEETKVLKEECSAVFTIRDEWDEGANIDVTMKNTSDYDIEDWCMEFDIHNEITKIWDAKIEKSNNKHYRIQNAGYNGIIKSGRTITWGMQIRKTETVGEICPDNITIMQVTQNPVKTDVDNSWNLDMIHASDDIVKEAAKQGEKIKVGLIDSGVDYSEAIDVVERKNFVDSYEESNVFFDDLSGHGTAVAGIMNSNKEKLDEEETDIPDEEEQQVNLNLSYLTDEDTYELKAEVDEETKKWFAESASQSTAQADTYSLEEAVAEDETADAEDVEMSDTQDAASEEEWNTVFAQSKIDGVNPNIEIYSARVLDENNEAPVSRVIKGIRWAIEKNVNIIHLSWGTDEDNAELHQVIKEAYNKNILLVAPAGNGEHIQYPAKYEEVMAVGSVQSEGKRAEQSATGEEMEVVAPGQDVVSYGSMGIANSFSGTSMAAPQVTALAAILWQKDITKSNEFIRQLIDVSANHLGNEEWFGYGLIDCRQALEQYDAFSKIYKEQNTQKENVEEALEKGSIEENQKPVEVTEETIVKALWDKDGHQALVHNLAILKAGAVYPDKVDEDDYIKETRAWFHGFSEKDYIAAYRFMTEMALHYAETGKWITDSEYFLAKYIDVKYGEKLNGQQQKQKEEERKQFKNFYKQFFKMLEVMDYDTSSKKKGSLFVYGMALHTLGDVFSHSTWGHPKNITKKDDDKNKTVVNGAWMWMRIMHGERQADGFTDNQADDKEIAKMRYKYATQVFSKIIRNNLAIKGKTVVEIKRMGSAMDVVYPAYLKKYNINTINKSNPKKWIEFMENGFSVGNIQQYVQDNLTEEEKKKRVNYDIIKNIDKDYVRTKTENKRIVYLKKKTKNNDKITYKVYQKLDDQSGQQQVTVHSKENTDYVYFVAEAGKTYIVQANKKVVAQIAKKQRAVHYVRYSCTKELKLTPADPGQYLENENGHIMCFTSVWEPNDSDFTVSTLKGKVTIADTDNDYGNDKVASNVAITLTDCNDPDYQLETTSGANGMYELPYVTAGVYRMHLSSPGYISTDYFVVVTSKDTTIFNPTIGVIGENYAGKGSASGKIVNAANGQGVKNLTLYFRKELGNTSGEICNIIKTGNNGAYSIQNMDAGYYTVEIVDERENVSQKFLTGTMFVRVMGGRTLANQNGVVSNGLDSEQIRIVLTWGANPHDLDSHLIGETKDGMRYHMYYANKVVKNKDGEVEFMLDVDDVTSYGPETTTIYHPVNADYEYYVYNFSRGSALQLMNSGAMVQVYKGNSNMPWKTFYVPQQSGYTWHVFHYNGETGDITVDNYIN